MKHTSKYILLSTGTVFHSRLEAKLVLGHSRFNKLMKTGEIIYQQQSDREGAC